MTHHQLCVGQMREVNNLSGRILLTGVSGQVGSALLPLLQRLGEVVAPTHADLDLTDTTAIQQWVRKAEPRWIVNAAAYTAVDKAEFEPALAYAINSAAVRVLGEEAKAMGAAVISFSTDYVFPAGDVPTGDGVRPWVETDATGPLGVYGASKLEGEKALAASGAAHFVFRTSWVYGATGNNFLRTILQLAREREEMKIVADQHGAPTWSEDLARLVVHTISLVEEETKRGRTLEDVVQEVGGVYHACGAGKTTWFGFASEFLRLRQRVEPNQRFARLIPIPSSEYPTSAKRPLNSQMSCERLGHELGYTMPRWEDSVLQVMEQLR